MTVNGGRFVFVTACILVFTQVQEAITQATESISQQCLDCICQAASGCDTLTGCKGDVCGPYRITEPYWSDSGKPTLDNDSNSPDGGFGRCVGDRSCSSRAVQGYMNRFARDCNGDGVINCDDYVRIHRLGCGGCDGPIAPEYQSAFQTCMSGGSAQAGAAVQSGGSVQAGGWPQAGAAVQSGGSAQPGGWPQTGAAVQSGGSVQAGGWPQPDRSAHTSC